MIVTINTDASFSKKYHRGSYAFWIACDEFKIMHSGMLRKKASNPSIAEYRCVINAFHVLFGMKTTRKITKIIVNTDSMNVIHLATNDKEAIQKYDLISWGRHLNLTLQMLLVRKKHFKTPIEYRHVRSHQDTLSRRTWVNEWCDVEAKKHMGEFIASQEKTTGMLKTKSKVFAT